MGKRLGMRQWLALKLFKKLRKIRAEEHILNTLFWECTLRCNLQCRHCGSDCRVDSALSDMPAEDFFKVLDKEITPNVNPNKVLVILSGGEVLVRKDLEQIGINLYRRGYPWGMVTNGLALTRQRLDSLIRAGLHSITVSLDGFEEHHLHIRQNKESFGRAVEAIRMISADKELASDVVTCVTPALLPHLHRFKEFLYSLGVRQWRLFTIFPVGRAAEDLSMQLNDEEFTYLMEFIEECRKEGRVVASYGCEGFLGGYETEVWDNFLG